MIVYAVSDATGDLAVDLATSALRQFKEENIPILRRAKIRNADKIAKVVREAKENDGFLVFTLVSHELRQTLLRFANEVQVPAVDVLGPALENLARYLKVIPSNQPGLQYEITRDYFRRNEAVEFSVKHDDGMGGESLDQAEIILMGISRTSKTPLSIYLSYRGFRTANIPIVRDVPIPSALKTVDAKKLAGLTIAPEKLVELRSARLARLGLPRSENYASTDYIRQELQYAEKIFEELGGIPVIDVTSKAIEEVATEVLTVLGK